MRALETNRWVSLATPRPCAPFPLLPTPLLLAPFAATAGAGGVDEDGVVLARGLCGALLRVVELLHEVALDLAAALVPPLPLGLGLGLDLVEALPEAGIGGDFVGRLEDGGTPVGSEGVGLERRGQLVTGT